MIHARIWGPGDENAPEDKTLQLTVTAESINQFKHILSRALNTVPPECPEYADWFALLDKLDPIIKSS